MRTYGWREMFFAFAVLGLVVGLILIMFLPKNASTTRADEPKAIPQARLRDVLKLPSTWLCAGGYMMFNAAFWGFLGWVPTYMKDERHISLADIGLLGSLPYFAGFVGMLIAGWLGSSLQSRRRPVLIGFCYAAAAVSLYFALTAHGVAGCVALACPSPGSFCTAVLGRFGRLRSTWRLQTLAACLLVASTAAGRSGRLCRKSSLASWLIV